MAQVVHAAGAHERVGVLSRELGRALKPADGRPRDRTVRRPAMQRHARQPKVPSTEKPQRPVLLPDRKVGEAQELLAHRVDQRARLPGGGRHDRRISRRIGHSSQSTRERADERIRRAAVPSPLGSAARSARVLRTTAGQSSSSRA